MFFALYLEWEHFTFPFVLNTKAIATGCKNNVCQKPQARVSILNSKTLLKFKFLLLCMNPGKCSWSKDFHYGFWTQTFVLSQINHKLHLSDMPSFLPLSCAKGLRASLLLSAFFMVLGAALRSIYWNQNHIGDRIQFVLYAEVGMIAALFVAVLLYFPSRPPIPPSVAAASQRLSYRNSICRLLSNMRFLMIALAYSVPTGVVAGWAGVLDMILTPAKVSQVDAGWIGFWSIVGGCVFGVAMARFADYIRGMLKLILVLMFAGASLAATWFTLTCLTRLTHLPSTKATLYTSCILVGIFINSSVPIFLELFIETVYPVPEGITCGVVTFLSNLFTGLMLFCLTFYFTELSWLNWCLTGSCIFSLLLLLFFRESYDRLYLDIFVSV
uniref:Solute carrier family 49 member 4 n=1 Tax=Sinocyclocheilus anshuiensis TaxID=1608454 RepID=A0A671QKS9_9TELE